MKHPIFWQINTFHSVYELECAHLPEYVKCDVSKTNSKSFSSELIILQYFNLTMQRNDQHFQNVDTQVNLLLRY